MDKTFFLSGTELGVVENEKEKLFESNYVAKYKKSALEILNKNSWKSKGASATFQGMQVEEGEQDLSYTLNGIAPFKDDSFIYSVSIGSTSGIFEKSVSDGFETHIIHSQNQEFFDLEYNDKSDKIVTSITSNHQTKDIAVFSFGTNDLNVLTDGDSVDECPSFSAFDGSILFSSRGIGRGASLNRYELGASSIYRMNDDGYGFQEILAEDNFDLLCPKEDSKGNLYYIKKPVKKQKKHSIWSDIANVLLLPFRLIYGLFTFLFFLARISTKDNKRKTGTTQGGNPSRFHEASERDLFLFDEEIKRKDIEKAEKNSESGIVPKGFQLIKRAQNGETSVIKEGVAGYSLDKDDNIVFTNGKRLMKINEKGESTVFLSKKLITKCSTQHSYKNKKDDVFGF